MSDAIRSSVFECFQGFFNSISLLFNQPTANHKSTPIKAIMTMHTNFHLVHSLSLGRSNTFLDNSNESLYVFFGRWDLGCSGILMICDGGIMEGCGIISSIDAVRDIDDMTYLGILADEMEWRVSMVGLAQSLCISYRNLVGYFHGPKGRCPDEI